MEAEYIKQVVLRITCTKLEAKMKKTYIVSMIIACVAFSTSAFAKDAKCRITLDGVLTDNDNCNFTPIKNDGSFRLSSSYQDVAAYKVTLTGKGVAKVYIEDLNGVSHYNGTAVRSKSDPACWNGNTRDLKICAYAK